MFYKRKFLLAVIEAFDGSIESLKFQKYLFLILKIMDKKYYNFVPYHYGCFSFESYNDKRYLINAGYLKQDENKWTLNKKCDFLSEISILDREYILDIKKQYKKLSKSDLLNHIYSKNPYYAINSRIILQAKLNPKQKKQILNNRPRLQAKCLFTIGYEGRSIDDYMNILIKNNVQVLFDVRKNPISRKYGFSKKSLQKIAENLGIKYLHIPKLGISSHLRKSLNSEVDYKKLFLFYKKTILDVQKEELIKIVAQLNYKKRIALTCFELDSSFCHRHCISSSLKQLNSGLNIKHL